MIGFVCSIDRSIIHSLARFSDFLVRLFHDLVPSFVRVAAAETETEMEAKIARCRHAGGFISFRWLLYAVPFLVFGCLFGYSIPSETEPSFFTTQLLFFFSTSAG